MPRKDKLIIVKKSKMDKLKLKIIGLMQTVSVLESLRPHWAQGYTDDSVAAQASTNALAELWNILGVRNQTDALEVLREITGVEPVKPRKSIFCKLCNKQVISPCEDTDFCSDYPYNN